MWSVHSLKIGVFLLLDRSPFERYGMHLSGDAHPQLAAISHDTRGAFSCEAHTSSSKAPEPTHHPLQGYDIGDPLIPRSRLVSVTNQVVCLQSTTTSHHSITQPDSTIQHQPQLPSQVTREHWLPRRHALRTHPANDSIVTVSNERLSW